MASLDRDGSPIGLVGALLALSLVIALLLAGQAQYAVRSHRKTVESVLSSTAALAGEELVRRSANEVGYQGYLRVLDALPSRLGVDPGSPAGGTNVSGGADLHRALRLVARSFVLEPAGPRFEGTPPGEEVTSWLAGRVAAAPTGPPLPYRVAGGVLAGAPRLFVWSARGGPSRTGFEVDLRALGDSFGRALSRGPLVPAAVGHGAVGNGSLSVSVRDHGGVERFRAGPAAFPQASRVPFGDAYGGVLDGFVAEVSLDPALAARLVPGGLPRSRLPALLGLVAVSAGLAITAGLQVRKERDLARLRETFVANVSHELRTPLAQIRLFTETLLLGRTRSDEEARRALVVIDREARRLSNLVDNVLAFSGGSGARPAIAMAIAIAPVDLAGVVLESVEGFRPLAAARDVRLALEAPATLPARADTGAVRQMLVNLLDNAVKYGPAGGEVTVRLSARSGRARIEVEDRGAGIAGADRARVFERFTRLPRQPAVAGTGIGLAVVRGLSVAHGGTAFVEERSGGGARFVVELPLDPETPS